MIVLKQEQKVLPIHFRTSYKCTDKYFESQCPHYALINRDALCFFLLHDIGYAPIRNDIYATSLV